MFVDTSVVVAIIMGEPEAARFAAAMEASDNCCMAAHVRLEACMVLSSRLNRRPLKAEEYFHALVEQTNARMLTIDDRVGKLAVLAFEHYGKGRGHPAQLNLADCLSYACAKAHGLPILFKGRDFSRTDLDIVSY